MTNSKHPWASDWEQRIIDEVQSHGFSTLTEYMTAYPCQSYHSLAKMLGDNVAPIQIIAVQYLEAKTNCQVRHAAKDSLCRNICDYIPKGWGRGENSEFKMASALTDWAYDLVITGKHPELDLFTKQFIDHFQAPDGWQPSGSDDPIICVAFDRFWPQK